MSEHTKEPWKVGAHCNDIETDYEPEERRIHGYGCDNNFICDLNDGEYHEYYSIEEQAATARRIVACVNACAGIEDPKAYMDKLRSERTELLKILSRFLDSSMPINEAKLFDCCTEAIPYLDELSGNSGELKG